MIGLIILLIVAVYISLWVLVTVVAYRFTLKGTQSKKKSYMVAGVFFMVMYLIPFWDLIPTLVMHKYYCSTQAGVWIYKTPEEWLAENSNSLALGELKEPDRVKIESSSDGWKKYHVNDRFVYEVNRSNKVFLSINLEEKILRDKKFNEPLIRKMDFWLGSGRSSIPSGGSIEGWRQFFIFEWFGKGKCSDNRSDDFEFAEKKFRIMGEQND